MRFNRFSLRKKLALSAVVAGSFALPCTVQAQTHTWTSAASGNWSDTANWFGATVATSAANTVIEFQGTGATAATLTNDLAANPFVVNGFNFNSTNTAGITIASVNPFSFVVDGVANPSINQNNSGAVTISAPVAVANPLTFGGNGAGTVTLSGAITGMGAFTKTSSGNLIISGANTNTAGWTVNNGTLTISNASTTAAGNLTFDNSGPTLSNGLGRNGTTSAPITLGNGTTLAIRATGDNTTTAQTLTYGNAVTVSPAATVTLDGNRNGTVSTGKTLGFGTLALGNGSQLNHGGGNNYRFLFNGLNVDTVATINVTQSFLTVNGAFVGTGTTPTLNKIGTTDLTLGAASSTLDTINVNSNRVFLTTNTWGTTKFNVAALTGNGTSLNWQGAAATLSNLVTVASTGGISNRGTGLFTLTNLTGLPAAGTLELNNDDSSTGQGISLSGNYPTLTGDLTFKFSGVRLNNTNNSIGSTAITGTLDVGAAPRIITMDYSATASSTAATTSLLTVGNLILTSNTTINGDGSGTLSAITGTGSLTFSGTQILNLNGGATSTANAGVTVTSGTVRIGNSSVITAGALSGGPVGTGTLNLSAGTILQDNGAIRSLGNNVLIAGNLTLGTSGIATTVNTGFRGVGVLLFDDLGLTTPNSITINSANPTLTVNNSTVFSAPVSVTGGAGFTKAGTGLLLIDSTYAGTGAIAVNTGGFGVGANAVPANYAANSITVASGAAFVLSNPNTAFLTALNSASAGSVALGVDSTSNLDFTTNLSNMSLGAAFGGAVFGGTITPAASTYRLGGGGGTLYVNSQLTGSNAVSLVGAGGGVALLNTTNSFNGEITIAANDTAGVNLAIKSDAALGASSNGLTFGSAPATPRLVLMGNVTTGSGRTFTVSSTGVSTIENLGNSVTLNNAFAGTSALAFDGRGTTTLGTAITTAIPLTTNAGSFAAGVPTGLVTALTGSPFGGANFVMNNNVSLTTGGAVSTTIANSGAATFTYLNGTLSVGASGSPGATVTLGGTGASFVRAGRGTLVLAPANGTANLGSVSGETYLVGGTAPTPTNGIVPFVFGRNSDANFSGTFLDYAGAAGFQPVAGTAVAAGAANIPNSATTVYDVTGAQTAQTTASTYALRTNSSIAIAASNTLTIAGGGLILNGTNPTISAGTLAFTGENSIYTSLGGGTISSVISNSATGLNITGPGQLTLSGLNTFATNLNIRGGILAVAGFTDSTTANTPLGTGNRTHIIDGGGTFRLLSGALDLVGGAKFFNLGAGGGTIDVLNGGTLTFNDANQYGTVAGTSGTLFVTNSGTGTGTTIFSNQTYAMNGPVVIGSTTGTAVFRYGANQNTTLTSTLGTGLASAFTVRSGGQLDIGTALPFNRTILLDGGAVISGSAAGATINGTIHTVSAGTIGGANPITINGEVLLDGSALNLNGASTVTVNGIISGAINNTLGVTKAAAGTAILANALNSYGGGTTVSAGTLQANSDGALGAASGGLTFTGASTFRFGDAFTINSGRTVAIGGNTVTVNTNTFNGNIAGAITSTAAGSLLKNGAGTLTIPTVISGHLGSTSVDAGTLVLTADQTLAGAVNIGSANTITTPANLDFSAANITLPSLTSQTNTATANVVTIGATKTLTVNGNLSLGTAASGTNTVQMSGGGALALASTALTAALSVGGANASRATLDLRGLSNFTVNYSNAGSVLRINSTSGTNTDGSFSTLYLPTTGAGTASITVGSLNVGDGSTNNGSAGQVNQLFLGSGLTTINANTLNIGNGGNRDLGQLLYEAANTTGLITIRAQNGLGRANLNVGAGVTNTGTGATPGNLFDVSNHIADLLLDAVNVGTQVRNSTLTSTFSFNQGTLNANTFTVGTKASSAFTATTAGIVNIGGGSATINNGFLIVGNNSVGVGTTSGTVNLSGGTISVGATGSNSFVLADATTAGGTANGTLNISGSANVTLSGNIAIGSTTGTENSTVNLTGGLLNMSGNNIANVTNLNFTGGTLRNAGIINRAVTQTGGTLERNVAGTTQIVGAYSASGAGTVVDISHASGILDVTGGLTIGTSAVIKGNGTVLNSMIVDGTVAPGNSIGTLTVVGNATFNTGSTFEAELGALNSSDLLNLTAIASDLSLASSTDTLNLLSTLDPGTFTIIDYTGTRSLGIFDIVNFNGTLQSLTASLGVTNPTGFTGTGDLYSNGTVAVFYNDSNTSVQIGVIAIPEPSTLVLGGLALLGFAGAGLRRRRLAQQ